MKNFKVFDLPTRMFHWSFAGLFLSSFFIAKAFDDESPFFSFHMLLGLILTFILVLRIVWGFVGTRYARFSSFDLKPSSLLGYFKNLSEGKPIQSLAHNAATSWAALIMMALVLGLFVTGYLMATGNKEAFEDIHELLANSFVILALTHIAGVLNHSFRYKDWLWLSMVTGKKQSFEGQIEITKSHRGVAFLALVLVGLFVFHLNRNYDANAQTLRFFGKTLQLGESEGRDDHQSSEGQGEPNGDYGEQQDDDD